MDTPASQQNPLDIDKALRALFNEVIVGTAHLNAAKSLVEASKTHPVITRTSPAFFNLTTRAHLEAAQLSAARLFDTHGDCAGIPWLLKQAKQRPDEFDHETAGDLEDAIAEAEAVCSKQGAVVAAIKLRRDKWLAHLDKRTIRDPKQFDKDAQLTYRELEELFASAARILSRMADVPGQAGSLTDDYDDLRHTLALAKKGLQAEAQELRRRMGPSEADLGGESDGSGLDSDAQTRP